MDDNNMGVGGFLGALLSLGVALYLGYVLLGAMTSTTYQANFTTRYEAYQAGETARELARQQARETEAAQWGETMRTWGTWGGGALAVVAVAGVCCWAFVRGEEERTRRTYIQEANATDRLRISTSRQIMLAWIAQAGYPDARPGQLGGVPGVLIPSLREFVPLDVCRAELSAARLLEVDADG